MNRTNNVLPYHDPSMRAPQLDWERFPTSILKLLMIKSFFKRFTAEQLKDKLAVSEIELYQRK